MQTITHKYGFEVITNCPDYKPEDEKKINERILQKLYEIIFNDNENS